MSAGAERTGDDMKLEWNVESEGVDRVQLYCAPVARVIPDGCRVTVTVYTETRDVYDSEAPGRRRLESYRVASVQLVDIDGERSKVGGQIRFAGTEASGQCWARAIESTRYDRRETGEKYWRCDQVTGWRADGFATDLPDGAMAAMRETFADAAAFVGLTRPELWFGQLVLKARRELADVDRDIERLKNDRRLKMKALKAAERVAARVGARVDGEQVTA